MKYAVFENIKTEKFVILNELKQFHVRRSSWVNVPDGVEVDQQKQHAFLEEAQTILHIKQNEKPVLVEVKPAPEINKELPVEAPVKKKRGRKKKSENLK